MKKLMSFLVVCALAWPMTSVLAQGPGSSGVLFLLIAPGARAAGMGESFVSIADDATATYWNPAGLAFQQGTEIALMHSNWLPQLAPDLYYDYATVRHSLGPIGTGGLSVTFINLGEQTITGEDPTPLGTFSSYELAVAGSFGSKLSTNGAIGVTLKFIYSNLAPQVSNTTQKGDGRATAFAVDLGYLQRNLLINKLNFGVNLTNVGPKIIYIDAAQADPLPTNLRLGFSYHLIKQEFNSLMLTTEFDRLLVAIPKKGESSDPVYKALFTAWSDESFNQEIKHIIANVGAEYWYNNLLALRMGYHYDEIGKVKYVSFGAGLKYSLYRLDFGYVSAGEGHPLSDTMRFSLTIGI